MFKRYYLEGRRARSVVDLARQLVKQAEDIIHIHNRELCQKEKKRNAIRSAMKRNILNYEHDYAAKEEVSLELKINECNDKNQFSLTSSHPSIILC